MRIVIDTNILVSHFLTRNPASAATRAVLRAIANRSLILTEATLAELINVIHREKFDRYTNAALRKEFIQPIRGEPTIIHVTSPIAACRDSDDDKFLEAAVHGNAKIIVTGDEDLLVMNGSMGLSIITAAEFLLL